MREAKLRAQHNKQRAQLKGYIRSANYYGYYGCYGCYGCYGYYGSHVEDHENVEEGAVRSEQYARVRQRAWLGLGLGLGARG